MKKVGAICVREAPAPRYVQHATGAESVRSWKQCEMLVVDGHFICGHERLRELGVGKCGADDWSGRAGECAASKE